MIYMIETVFKPLFCEIRYLVYIWTTPTVYALMFTVTNQPRRAGYAVFTCIMYNVKCSILVTIINKINQSIIIVIVIIIIIIIFIIIIIIIIIIIWSYYCYYIIFVVINLVVLI